MNSSVLKKAFPHLIAIAVFLIVAVVYCKPALEGKVVSQSDVVQWKQMAQQSFEYKEKHGHFPLWTESTFGGMPAYTIAMSNQSFLQLDPLSKTLSLGLPEPINYFWLACISFYILMVVMGINPWVGIMASLAYAYSTYDPVIIVTGHVTKMLAISYAPGVIAGLLLLYTRRYIWGLFVFTLFFALQINSNHLQVVYYVAMAMGLMTIFYLVDSVRKQQLKPMLIGIALAAVGGLIAYGTSTSGTLPLQEYTKETMRGGRTELASSTGKQETGAGLEKWYAFQWSYGIGETVTLFAPNIYGGGGHGRLITDNSKFAEKLNEEMGMPEDNGLAYVQDLSYWGPQPSTSGPVYLGAVIVFLSILGFILVKGWQRWWLLSISIVGIVLAWGDHFKAVNYFLFDYLPLNNKFRAPTLALILPQLAAPILAALGLTALIENKEPAAELFKKFKLTAYVGGALVVLLAGIYFMGDYQGSNDNRFKEQLINAKIRGLSQGKQPGPDAQAQAVASVNSVMKGLQDDRRSIAGHDLLRTTIFFLLTGLLIYFFLKGRIKPMALTVVLLVLSTYDLIAVDSDYLGYSDYIEQSDFEAALQPTQADQQIKADPDKGYRVVDELGGDPFTDARASYFHNSLGGYSPAKLGMYQDLIDSQLRKGNMQVYNMLNAKYFIQRDPQTNQPVARVNPQAYGPCWLVSSIHYVADGKEEMRALDSINVRDTVIIQKKFADQIKTNPVPDSTASIKLITNDNDDIKYTFSSKTDQFAVFSEIYYDKGWNAYIDGNKAPYFRVDYLLRGMPVPAGNHAIEFKFEPHSYAISQTIAGLSDLLVYLLLIAVIVSELRRRKAQTPTPAKA